MRPWGLLSATRWKGVCDTPPGSAREPAGQLSTGPSPRPAAPGRSGASIFFEHPAGGKSGVSGGEIRCQFIILARRDEPKPDYARKDEPTPDYAPLIIGLLPDTHLQP